MRYIILGLVLIIGISCSKSDDPAPVKYDSILGNWEIENSGVKVTFDVIKVKNPSYPFDPKTDSLFTTNIVVNYLGKTGYSDQGGIEKVTYENGFYYFTISNSFGECPICAGNGGQLNAFIPNSAFTEMKSQETDPTGINYPYDGSWVSLVAFDGTLNQKVVSFKNPIVLKRIKGPY